MSLIPMLIAMLSLLLGGLLVWTLWGERLILRAHPPTGRFITVDGIRLHYVEAGAGPVIVLVHGASSNLNEFTGSLMPALAARHRVIAFDRPGYGHSARAPGRDWLDPAGLAKLLLDAAAALGAERPLLLGHSWAGAVVMAAQVEMPERIAGGVLLSGVAGHWAGPLGWTYQLGDIPVLGPLFAWTLVYPLGRLLLEDGIGEVLAPGQPTPGHVRRTAAMLALRPRTFLDNVRDTNRLNEYMQLLSPRYDRIGNPLLIIHGEADMLVPYWNHGRRLLPVIRHSRVLLLPDAGHAPHHTHLAEVAGAISAFQYEMAGADELPPILANARS